MDYIDNIGEIKRVEHYGLKCVRALCNVDAAELDTNPNLPKELLDSVVILMNHIGIPVDIIFSPVSPSAHQIFHGKSHIQRLIDNFTGNDPNALSELAVIYNSLTEQSLLPQRWVLENFGNKSYSPIPESNNDGTPTGHPAGAALYLARAILHK